MTTTTTTTTHQPPTHYTILSLPAGLPPTHQNYQTILKKAYHRTLLRCHPDKLPLSAVSAGVGVNGGNGGSPIKARFNNGFNSPKRGVDASAEVKKGKTTSSGVGKDVDVEEEVIYTIDQINTAYRTLASREGRIAYDLSLRKASAGEEGVAMGTGGYKTGLEVLDLDDMIYHEGIGLFSGDGEAALVAAAQGGGRWTKSCRCGAVEGYVLSEEEMEEVEEEITAGAVECGVGAGANGGARSMVVGCLGCSLWVQVDWVVWEEGDEEVEEAPKGK